MICIDIYKSFQIVLSINYFCSLLSLRTISLLYLFDSSSNALYISHRDPGGSHGQSNSESTGCGGRPLAREQSGCAEDLLPVRGALPHPHAHL